MLFIIKNIVKKKIKKLFNMLLTPFTYNKFKNLIIRNFSKKQINKLLNIKLNIPFLSETTEDTATTLVPSGGNQKGIGTLEIPEAPSVTARTEQSARGL